MLSVKNTIRVGSLAGLLYLVAARPADIIKDLGLTAESMKQDVLDNFKHEDGWSFNASSEMGRLARKIPEGSRVAAVQALGRVVRTYAESGEFKQTYQDWLKEEYLSDPAEEPQPEPQAEEKKAPITSGDRREQLIQQLYGEMPTSLLTMMIQEQIKEADASKTGKTAATASTRPLEGKELKRIAAIAKTNADSFRQQYLHYLAMNVDPSVQLLVSSGNDRLQEQNALFKAQERKELLVEYEKRKDLKQVTRNRLKNFIAFVNTIDFDAKLIRRGSKMAFADPDLESKDGDWKLLYRIGKEPVMAARGVAQQWLSDLDSGKSR